MVLLVKGENKKKLIVDTTGSKKYSTLTITVINENNKPIPNNDIIVVQSN